MADDVPSWVKADSVPDWVTSPKTTDTKQLDQQQHRGIMDQLLGLTGPRFQTFPERAVRNIGGDIQSFMQAGAAGPPGSREVTQAAIPAAAEIAMQATPLGPESRIAKAAIAGKSVISAERQSAVDILKNEGIEVSAGQARGSQPLRTAESALGTAPLSGDVATEQFNRQMRQFTRAVLNRVGENSDRATPEVIDRAFDRMGNEFDRLEKFPIVPDEQFANEIAQAKNDYFAKTSPYSRSEYLSDIGNRMAMYAHKGMEMPGEVYKSARSQLTRLRRGVGDPVMKETLNKYIEALDGAAERTLVEDNPAALTEWKKVRRQYRNMLVIEKALPAGETGAEGLITPAKLRQAALAQDKRSFRRGKSDFSDLALAGEQLLTPVRTSKTSERANALAMPAEIGAAIAALLSGNLPIAGGATAALLGPGVGGRILMNPRVQEFLKRQKPKMRRSGTIPQELFYRGGVAELLKNLGGQNAPQ